MIKGEPDPFVVDWELLVCFDICEKQEDLFAYVFGHRTEVNLDTLATARCEGLGVDWFAEKLFGEAYTEAVKSIPTDTRCCYNEDKRKRDHIIMDLFKTNHRSSGYMRLVEEGIWPV